MARYSKKKVQEAAEQLAKSIYRGYKRKINLVESTPDGKLGGKCSVGRVTWFSRDAHPALTAKKEFEFAVKRAAEEIAYTRLRGQGYEVERKQGSIPRMGSDPLTNHDQESWTEIAWGHWPFR